jgi:diaminohydroxyphosphoribosylaminopyrimidine deaminase/5-amino-6-(5-phosphoribosylamino)uracil reductase
MRAALAEARRGVGKTSPNPAVGAVIVRGGRIIARGWHHGVGLPHAEIEALAKTKAAGGATLYVTLEPCSTHGRTPPCTDAIIRTNLIRVVIGAADPNPSHAGRGFRLLEAAGIEVTTGVLAEECAALNRPFNHWITTGLPWVIAKAGMSLDGRLTRPPGEGQWLTSAAARRHALKLRASVDAILVGAETVRTDNPRLTVRGVRGARQPWRVVLTRSGKLPSEAHLFTDEHQERTLVFKGKTLRAVLRELGQRQITSVLIEGGGEVLGQAFDQTLVNEARFYVAPLLSGGPKMVIGGNGVSAIEAAPFLKNPSYEKVGGDLCLSGEVTFPI